MGGEVSPRLRSRFSVAQTASGQLVANTICQQPVGKLAVARFVRDEEVVGSNPASPTIPQEPSYP